MKKQIILTCLCISSMMVSAQSTFVLKHQKDTTISFKLVPYKYSHKKCDTVDLDLTLVYDQENENIIATLISKKQSQYNLLWIPPKDNGFYLTNTGKFKKNFKAKYNVALSLNSRFKKQVKEVKLTELYPITYRNCEFSGYNVADTVKCTSGKSKKQQPKLLDEMFNVNMMNSMGLKLSMNYKILNKANVVDIRFFGFIPTTCKEKSSVYNNKVELQYVADGPLINIKLQRDPCVDERFALQKVDSLIENLKSQYNDLELAKAEKNKRECDQIKSKIITQDKSLNIDGLYGNSSCSTLLSTVEEYHSWVKRITKYSDDMTCILDAGEINQAAVKINKLVTKWDIDKKTDISEIEDIIKTMNSKINKYGNLCKSVKKVKDAIDSYNGAVDFYHIKVKK